MHLSKVVKYIFPSCVLNKIIPWHQAAISLALLTSKGDSHTQIIVSRSWVRHGCKVFTQFSSMQVQVRTSQVKHECDKGGEKMSLLRVITQWWTWCLSEAWKKLKKHGESGGRPEIILIIHVDLRVCVFSINEQICFQEEWGRAPKKGDAPKIQGRYALLTLLKDKQPLKACISS